MRRIEIRSMLDTTDNDEDVCTALTRAISESPVCAQVHTIMVREMDVREPSVKMDQSARDSRKLRRVLNLPKQ